MANAKLVTPDTDPVTFDRVRILVRGGIATVTNARGATLWTAHLAAVRKVGHASFEFDLTGGGTARVTRYTCNCCQLA